MIRFLFSEHRNKSVGTDRKRTGIICASAGIFLNLMLFFIKLIAGSISGSVAVTVDAVHNLTDMGSSAVTLISFILPEKNKTVKENVAGLIIGIVLIAAGVELLCTSAEKIIEPEKVEFSFISVFLLTVSVLVKLFMALFNKHFGIKAGSAALKAASLDCLCDALATMVAAFAVVAAKFTDLNIDAYGGITVSLFILFAGCQTSAQAVRELIVFICRK